MSKAPLISSYSKDIIALNDYAAFTILLTATLTSFINLYTLLFIYLTRII